MTCSKIEVAGRFPARRPGVLHIGPEDLLLRGPYGPGSSSDWRCSSYQCGGQRHRAVHAAAVGGASQRARPGLLRPAGPACDAAQPGLFFSIASPVPGPLSSLLFYLLQPLTVVLLGHFVRAHVQQEAPRLRWLLQVGGGALALAGTIGTWPARAMRCGSWPIRC